MSKVRRDGKRRGRSPERTSFTAARLPGIGGESFGNWDPRLVPMEVKRLSTRAVTMESKEDLGRTGEAGTRGR
jgi:hypothetical protein